MEPTCCQWAVCLCNKVWCGGHVSDDWHEVVVSAFFKKGDPASCENYRPISLLAIGYKLFATILLRRLKSAAADAKIWPTQFGFRTGRGCANALFVARRLLERTCPAKNGSLVFLALDWAKAFDSIFPDGLIVALRRFGIPDGFCAIIRAIYSGRRFVVRDAGHTSEPRPQHFGISQGCPLLSPFLFSIVMTALLFDASAQFAMEVETRQPCVLPDNELVYANDTLVVATDPCRAETHMRCIEAMGMNYGLRLNWKKCEVLPIGCEASIAAPDGSYLTFKSSISCLGSCLDATGAGGPKICRRLDETKGQFDKLARVWRHSTLHLQQKIRIFQAFVVSRLLYCLHTMWLNKAELRKIDGLQAKCLRSILHIQSPYISRLSNATVLQKSHCKRLSAILKFRQLCLFQSIAVLPDDDVRRRCIFQPSSFILQNLSAPRLRGRLKQIWASEVYRTAVEIADGFDMLGDLLRDAAKWRSKVRAFCFLPPG